MALPVRSLVNSWALPPTCTTAGSRRHHHSRTVLCTLRMHEFTRCSHVCAGIGHIVLDTCAWGQRVNPCMRRAQRTVREWWWRLLPAVVQVGGKAQELTGTLNRQRHFALGLRGSQGDRPVGTYPGFLVSFPPVAAWGDRRPSLLHVVFHFDHPSHANDAPRRAALEALDRPPEPGPVCRAAG